MVDTGFLTGLVIGMIAGFSTGMLYGKEKEMTKDERKSYSMLIAAGMIIAFLGIILLIVMNAGLF